MDTSQCRCRMLVKDSIKNECIRQRQSGSNGSENQGMFSKRVCADAQATRKPCMSWNATNTKIQENGETLEELEKEKFVKSDISDCK